MGVLQLKVLLELQIEPGHVAEFRISDRFAAVFGQPPAVGLRALMSQCLPPPRDYAKRIFQHRCTIARVAHAAPQVSMAALLSSSVDRWVEPFAATTV